MVVTEATMMVVMILIKKYEKIQNKQTNRKINALCVYLFF
jgi:hypothetical protein